MILFPPFLFTSVGPVVSYKDIECDEGADDDDDDEEVTEDTTVTTNKKEKTDLEKVVYFVLGAAFRKVLGLFVNACTNEAEETAILNGLLERFTVPIDEAMEQDLPYEKVISMSKEKDIHGMRLVCVSKFLFDTFMEVENEEISPCLKAPYMFVVFGARGFTNLVDRRIRASSGYNTIDHEFDQCLQEIGLSAVKAQKWAYEMTTKLFNYYKGAAIDDFAIRCFAEIGNGRLLTSTEKMSFRNQVATNKIISLSESETQ